jgi:MFS family permease
MRKFLILWSGQLVSLVGNGLTGFALGIWVFHRNGSVTDLAMWSLWVQLPGLLLSPLAGVLVDRWDRRKIMFAATVGAGACSLAMALLFLAGRLELWHIYLLRGASFVCSALLWPAYLTATTSLVEKRQLGRAAGLMQLAQAAAQVFAPALAGVLIAPLGMGKLLLIDVSTFLVVCGTLLLVRIPALPAGDQAKKKSGFREEAALGWSYIRSQRGLLGLLLYSCATAFLASVALVLATPLVLGFAAETKLGLVFAIASGGMVLGGLAMSLTGGPKRRMRGVLLSGVLLTIGLVLTGARPSLPTVALGAFIFFFGIAIQTGCNQAIWQSKVPERLQGRVLSFRRMLVQGISASAFVVAGPLSDKLFEPWLAVHGPLAGSVGRLLGTGPGRGIGLLLILLGVLCGLATLLTWAQPRLRRIEDELPDPEDGQGFAVLPGLRGTAGL